MPDFDPQTRRLLRILRRDTGLPVHQLLKLSWADFLLEAACTFQGEEDFAWELREGVGKDKLQKILSVHNISDLTGLV